MQCHRNGERSVYVSKLAIYPVKSMAPLLRQRCIAEPRGLAGDRRWMVIDADDRFVTGRALPQLVLCQVSTHDHGLTLSMHGDSIQVALPAASAATRDVVVWRDTVAAHDAGDAVAAWLSTQFQRPLRLVCQADDQHRWLAEGKALARGDEVSFADGYPLLLIGSASLQDLNDRLRAAVTMQHFRPNVVVATDTPFVEDTWRSVAIGSAVFDVATACSRCIFTTVDPVSGARREDGEPLRTLRDYRRLEGEGGKIMFGMNLITRVAGTLSVNDVVRVIARRTE
ncbi:MAG: MOSC N-terminal beta barrel domain-containing protein [Pseudomonadota bacterium]